MAKGANKEGEKDKQRDNEKLEGKIEEEEEEEHEEDQDSNTDDAEGEGEEAEIDEPEEEAEEPEGEGDTSARKRKRKHYLQLPLARVKKMIKSDPEVSMIAAPATVMITKATEVFVADLVRDSTKIAKREKKKIVRYSDVANAVASHDKFVFLLDIVPKKKSGFASGGNGSLIQTTLV